MWRAVLVGGLSFVCLVNSSVAFWLRAVTSSSKFIPVLVWRRPARLYATNVQASGALMGFAPFLSFSPTYKTVGTVTHY